MNPEELAAARLAFLEDTVAFYKEDPSRRAVEAGRCKYRTEDGRKCAIGRHIPDELYTPDIENCTAGTLKVFNLLPESVKRLGDIFLGEVQSLHDGNSNWQKDELLEDEVNEIKERHGLNNVPQPANV